MSAALALPQVPLDADALPRSDFVTSALCLPGVFTPAECRELVRLGNGRMQYRTVELYPSEGYRSARTLWLPRGEATRLLAERLSFVVDRARHRYGFEVTCFRDHFLLCEYAEGDGFEWHVDAADRITSTRKLSLSVQLSDPADYDGGALEFMPQGELPFSRSQGSVVVFPSYLCHRVSRVARGGRWSAVAFAHGPTFR